ncbi:hypothetical protein MASR2M17_17190 [Aminivibrio sp.]
MRLSRKFSNGRGSLFSELHIPATRTDSAETIRPALSLYGRHDLSDSLSIAAGVDDLFDKGSGVLRLAEERPDRTLPLPLQEERLSDALEFDG